MLLPAGDAARWAGKVCSADAAIFSIFHSEDAARTCPLSYILATVSGWGCRHELDEQCLLLRKECKPGMPGCVLYRKVRFIAELEAAPPKRTRKRPARPSGKPKAR